MHPKAFLSTALLPSQWSTVAAYFLSLFPGLLISCYLLVFVPCRYICADGTEAENYLISVCNSEAAATTTQAGSTARAQKRLAAVTEKKHLQLLPRAWQLES